MQRSTHAVRYYIVKHDDEAEIKMVPVAIKDIDQSARGQRPTLRSAASDPSRSMPVRAGLRGRQLTRAAARRVEAER